MPRGFCALKMRNHSAMALSTMNPSVRILNPHPETPKPEAQTLIQKLLWLTCSSFQLPGFMGSCQMFTLEDPWPATQRILHPPRDSCHPCTLSPSLSVSYFHTGPRDILGLRCSYAPTAGHPRPLHGDKCPCWASRPSSHAPVPAVWSHGGKRVCITFGVNVMSNAFCLQYTEHVSGIGGKCPCMPAVSHFAGGALPCAADAAYHEWWKQASMKHLRRLNQKMCISARPEPPTPAAQPNPIHAPLPRTLTIARGLPVSGPGVSLRVFRVGPLSNGSRMSHNHCCSRPLGWLARPPNGNALALWQSPEGECRGVPPGGERALHLSCLPGPRSLCGAPE